VRIAITAAATSDDTALSALADWLRHDPDVRRRATVTERPTGAVDVDFDDAGTVITLLRAYAAWRHSRLDRPAVTLRVRGVPVRIEGAMPEAAAWIEALLAADTSLARPRTPETPGSAPPVHASHSHDRQGRP
jgi:membrane-associated two-gene conflict system component 1 (EACC1)